MESMTTFLLTASTQHGNSADQEFTNTVLTAADDIDNISRISDEQEREINELKAENRKLCEAAAAERERREAEAAEAAEAAKIRAVRELKATLERADQDFKIRAVTELKDTLEREDQITRFEQEQSKQTAFSWMRSYCQIKRTECDLSKHIHARAEESCLEKVEGYFLMRLWKGAVSKWKEEVQRIQRTRCRVQTLWSIASALRATEMCNHAFEAWVLKVGLRAPHSSLPAGWSHVDAPRLEEETEEETEENIELPSPAKVWWDACYYRKAAAVVVAQREETHEGVLLYRALCYIRERAFDHMRARYKDFLQLRKFLQRQKQAEARRKACMMAIFSSWRSQVQANASAALIQRVVRGNADRTAVRRMRAELARKALALCLQAQVMRKSIAEWNRKQTEARHQRVQRIATPLALAFLASVLVLAMALLGFVHHHAPCLGCRRELPVVPYLTDTRANLTAVHGEQSQPLKPVLRPYLTITPPSIVFPLVVYAPTIAPLPVPSMSVSVEPVQSVQYVPLVGPTTGVYPLALYRQPAEQPQFVMPKEPMNASALTQQSTSSTETKAEPESEPEPEPEPEEPTPEEPEPEEPEAEPEQKPEPEPEEPEPGSWSESGPVICMIVTLARLVY